MNFPKFQKLVEDRTGFRTMENPMASGDYFSDSCGDMYTYFLQVGPGGSHRGHLVLHHRLRLRNRNLQPPRRARDRKNPRPSPRNFRPRHRKRARRLPRKEARLPRTLAHRTKSCNRRLPHQTSRRQNNRRDALRRPLERRRQSRRNSGQRQNLPRRKRRPPRARRSRPDHHQAALELALALLPRGWGGATFPRWRRADFHIVLKSALGCLRAPAILAPREAKRSCTETSPPTPPPMGDFVFLCGSTAPPVVDLRRFFA